MDAWVIWLIVAVVFAVAEVINLSFYLFPFAIGAAGAAVVDLAGGGAGIAWATFAALTAVSFTVVRPIARRHLEHAAADPHRDRGAHRPHRDRHRAHRQRRRRGRVRIDGEVWSARAYDEDKVIEAGTRVHVLEIQGATALVSD